MSATVARICGRLAGSTYPQVSPLEYGGVQVRLSAGCDERRRWVLLHRLRRELTLVGWQVEADESRLLVLGWSASSLEHRIRMLRLALTALQEVAATIGVAVTLTEQHRRRFPRLSRQEVSTSVLADVEREHLRWPTRLAELNGLLRFSSRPALQRQLGASLELEQHVAVACSRHMDVAGQAVEAMWRHLAEHGREPAAARRAAVDEIASVPVAGQQATAAAPATAGGS